MSTSKLAKAGHLHHRALDKENNGLASNYVSQTGPGTKPPYSYGAPSSHNYAYPGQGASQSTKHMQYDHYSSAFNRIQALSHPTDNSLEGGARFSEQHRSFGQELTNMGGVETHNKPSMNQATRVVSRLINLSQRLNTTRLHLDGIQHPHLQPGHLKSSRNQSRENHNTSLNSGLYLYSRGPASRKNLHSQGNLSTKHASALNNMSSAATSSRGPLPQPEAAGSSNRAHSASSMNKKQRGPSNSITQPLSNQTSYVPHGGHQPAMAPPPSLGGPRRPSFRKIDSLASRNRMVMTGQNTSRSGSEERGNFGAHRVPSSQVRSGSCSVQNSDVKAKRIRLGEFYTSLEKERENKLLPCDLKDCKNPQLCGEYASEITDYISEIEARFLPRHGYMKKQNDINQRMRAILIDWLVDVHLKFKLLPQTLYLTVNMIDRYLDKEVITRRKLQLVGISAMLISSKYQEIYPPEIKDFTYITDRAYSKQDVLDMEGNILSALEFNITVPSSYRFLERFARLSNLEISHFLNVADNQMGSTGLRTFMFARYLSELALIDYNFLQYTPRQVAAASTYIALRLMKFSPPWNENLKQASGLDETDLKPCAKDLMNLLDQAEKSNLKAVRKKYSQKKFMEVAKIKLDIPKSDEKKSKLI